MKYIFSNAKGKKGNKLKYFIYKRKMIKRSTHFKNCESSVNVTHCVHLNSDFGTIESCSNISLDQLVRGICKLGIKFYLKK